MSLSSNRGIKINRERSTIFQLNIGLFCNQVRCNHSQAHPGPRYARQPLG
ncbi:unnamed protein product [Ectocarpus sp. 12 AP-2014]